MTDRVFPLKNFPWAGSSDGPDPAGGVAADER